VSDFGFKPPSFIQDIPNALLVGEERGSWGAYARSETSFRKISDSSCEISIKIDFNGIDEKVVGMVIGEVIIGFMMLDYGYNAGIGH